MTIFGRTIALRTMMLIAGLILIVILSATIPQCVSKWRSERAQSRVDASQAGAASKSAGDAINAVASAGAREATSEDLTRDNARDIANAPGAGERVNSGVDLAGRKALCGRAAYANDPKCKGAK